jgi:formimidoylglutamate deiminase
MTERFVFCPRALTPEGWRDNLLLHLDGIGMIRRISSASAADGHPQLSGPVIPGMPNVHSHAFQRLMAGRTGRPSEGQGHFWSWRDAMYRLANRISPSQLQSTAAWLYTEMLCNGYTSCAEFHYLHHQANGSAWDDPAEMSLRVLAAAGQAGLPLTLLPVLYCHSGLDGHGVNPEQRRFAHQPESYLRLLEALRPHTVAHPHHQLGMAPHSLRAVSEKDLREVLAAASCDGPIHIHIAEQQGEVDDCQEALGARPVDWLLDHFEVNERWCLVHATHLSDSERHKAAQSGAIAGLCPTTEADLGDGFFDTQAWLAAGGSLGIGTDSNLRIAVSEELRLLEFSERLRQQRRNVLSAGALTAGERLYREAAASGGRALGQPVGQIATGFRADLVELDAGHPLMSACEPDALLDTYVFAGGASMIRSVMVAGQVVVESGHHHGKDELARGFSAVLAELS